MSRLRKLKNCHSVFKDKTKIIKAKLSITNHTTSAIQIAVLRATTRSARSPPPDHLISALVSFSHTARHSALACNVTIINRLHHHHQPNAYVALKSLITLHHLIVSGSFVHNEQLELAFRYKVSSATRFDFLNLSRFVDDTDSQSREFSLWAQWYARVLENNVSTTTILGCYMSLSKAEIEKKREKLKLSLYADLFKEIESMVSTVEEISKAPRLSHCRKNDIIYEVIKLVGEDYRKIQYHTTSRLIELSDRAKNLSTGELNGLTRCLERLEKCEAGLTELFANRMRNEPFWKLQTELKTKLVRLKEEKEVKSGSWKMIEYETGSTQLKKQLSRSLLLLWV
ncbi:hypothetical protein SSX86_000589 [Deinandra increscens subsp. villosa]|uniref:ENTH domain-containing protein n=1 Tax=Deinandra increscens subsp. villosa TaxID=3103831 RepID=A0AAP0DTF6_9ASTR